MGIEEDIKKLMWIKEDIKKFHKFADYVEEFQPSLAMTFEEMVALSDKDFANHYLALMKISKVTEGWWLEGNIPICSYCNEEISSLQQLRMYKSKPYHPNCFRRVYEQDGESALMKKYWERVLVLDF